MKTEKGIMAIKDGKAFSAGEWKDIENGRLFPDEERARHCVLFANESVFGLEFVNVERTINVKIIQTRQCESCGEMVHDRFAVLSKGSGSGMSVCWNCRKELYGLGWRKL